MRFKKELINRDNGFLVQFVFCLFYILERISVFYWLRVLGVYIHQLRHPDSPNKPFVKSYIFPEIWVVGNIVFAILAEKISHITNNNFLLIFFIVYSIERVMEMFVYQVNVLFFHRLNRIFLEPKVSTTPKADNKKEIKKQPNTAETEAYMIKSSTRTVILLILNMIEYVLQFSVIFTAVGVLFPQAGTLVGIMGSFEIFMNMVNPEEIINNKILMLAYIETLIGMFMNLICLARFVGMLPEVAEKGIQQPEQKL